MVSDLNEREKIILNKLSADGSVMVADLAKDMGLSEVTIRNDLKNLELKGWINRIRGGAAPSMHQDILERQNIRIFLSVRKFMLKKKTLLPGPRRSWFRTATRL